MRGGYYKHMDENKRKHLAAWKEITNKRIENLNLIRGEKDCFSLGYRGRNHRIVLLSFSTTLACGIININNVLDMLEERYFKKYEKTSDTH